MNDELEELIAETSDVKWLNDSAEFLKKLEAVCPDSHEYVMGQVAENIDVSKVADCAVSDTYIRNTFDEIGSSFVYAINEYLKEKRDDD